ncbi:hypothetical protein Droror1_Dr00005763 [Drosera rotundifolia]
MYLFCFQERTTTKFFAKKQHRNSTASESIQADQQQLNNTFPSRQLDARTNLESVSTNQILFRGQNRILNPMHSSKPVNNAKRNQICDPPHGRREKVTSSEEKPEIVSTVR